MAMANTLSETIGNTPLLRLTQVTQGIKPLIAAKCEFFSPSGSLKDRILVHMVESAERDGRLRPGMTIIEGSTGNTGISAAMVAAAKGISMPHRYARGYEPGKAEGYPGIWR